LINPAPQGDGYYNIPGIGLVEITQNTKKMRHSPNVFYNSSVQFNVQLKNTNGGYQQLTSPTYVRYVPTLFLYTNFMGRYKPNISVNVTSFNAGAGSIYTWSVPGANVNDIDNTTPEATIYFPSNVPVPNNITGSLTVTNSPYCNGTYGIYFEYNYALISESNLSKNSNSLLIYPNPTTTQITISTTNNALIQSVEIGNLFNPIIKRVVGNNSKTSSINVSTLLPGIYNCKITTNKGIEYQKLIIKR
jgi:hypothetical protein